MVRTRRDSGFPDPVQWLNGSDRPQTLRAAEGEVRLRNALTVDGPYGGAVTIELGAGERVIAGL